MNHLYIILDVFMNKGYTVSSVTLLSIKPTPVIVSVIRFKKVGGEAKLHTVPTISSHIIAEHLCIYTARFLKLKMIV